MSMLVTGAMLAGTACTSTNTGSGTTGTTAGSTSTSNARTGTTTGGGTTMGSGTTTGGTTTGGMGTTTGGGSTTGTTTGMGTTGTTTGGTTGTTGGTTGGTTTGTTGGATGTTTGGGTTGTMGGGTTGTTAGGATAGTTMDMTNMTDAMFMMTAASSNMFEIQAGKLATQSASSPEVKKFAQMMVDHHTRASKEQMTLATQMKITLPKTLMPPHQALMDKLQGKTGKAFDEDYMDVMETAHKMDIAMFTMKSTNAETPSVKALAAKTLPMLKTHQEQATKIEDMVD
ncbi:DUF4142 domain-containing protein [Rufibacter tibetensis]|nr:DUF4142 domain-containing protein [Rufibacter tibetensis]